MKYIKLNYLHYTNYSISNCGSVRNDFTGNILKPYCGDSGYYKVSLSELGVVSKVKTHRLVAEMFCEKPHKTNLVVNHINGIKTDNRYTNLEWTTQTDNLNHAFSIGLTDKKIRPVLCVETGTEYPSAYRASKDTLIGQGSITNVCRGIGKTAGGFTWKYID